MNPRDGANMHLSIGVNSFKRILREVLVDLDSYMPIENGMDYHLTLKQVKAIVKKRKYLLSIAGKGFPHNPITSWDIMFCEIAIILEADADAYLCEAIEEADRLGLSDIKRLRFLQRKSAKYRVYFC
jgi:hypothetical protein